MTRPMPKPYTIKFAVWPAREFLNWLLSAFWELERSNLVQFPSPTLGVPFSLLISMHTAPFDSRTMSGSGLGSLCVS